MVIYVAQNVSTCGEGGGGGYNCTIRREGSTNCKMRPDFKNNALLIPNALKTKVKEETSIGFSLNWLFALASQTKSPLYTVEQFVCWIIDVSIIVYSGKTNDSIN